MADPLNWTEREAGDWEACVPASGMTALVYGGVTDFPFGIYTQAERERNELVADESMTYAGLDIVFARNYGVTLRYLSTGTIADAVTRPGIGLLLSGPGFPYVQWGGGVPTFHSIFFIPKGNGVGLLFDPMAPDQSPGVMVNNSVIVNWAKGAGPNDAREVTEGEFGVPNMPYIQQVTSVPAGSSVQFSSGVTYQFWEYDPASGVRSSFAVTPGASGASTTAIVKLDNEPPAYLIPRIYDGARWHDNVYLGTNWAPLYSPPVPVADCTAELAQIGALKGQITSISAQVAGLQATLNETVARLDAAEDLNSARDAWFARRPKAWLGMWLRWFREYPE